MKQNNIKHLKECLTLNKQKNTRMSFSKLNPHFLHDLHHDQVSNEH